MFATTKLQANEAGAMVVVDHPIYPWSMVTKDPGPVMRCIEGMRDAHLLPEAYLYGFAFTWRFADQRNAYDIGTIEIRDGKVLLRSRAE